MLVKLMEAAFKVADIPMGAGILTVDPEQSDEDLIVVTNPIRLAPRAVLCSQLDDVLLNYLGRDEAVRNQKREDR